MYSAAHTLRVARTSPRLAEVVAWRATGSPRSIEFAGERVGPTASDGQPAVSADARLAGPEAERPPSSTCAKRVLDLAHDHGHTRSLGKRQLWIANMGRK